jgi:hypothetical protein
MVKVFGTRVHVRMIILHRWVSLFNICWAKVDYKVPKEGIHTYDLGYVLIHIVSAGGSMVSAP